MPDLKLTADEVETMRRIGDNKGCMHLKGGNPQYTGEAQPDQWPMTPELEAVAQRWGVNPQADLTYAHAA